MRISLILAGVLVASSIAFNASGASSVKSSGTAAAPAVRTLPIFEFMGENTETVTSRRDLNGSQCSTSGVTLDCTDFNDPQVAGRPMRWLSLYFNNGRLYRVLASFGEYAYADLASAFSAKYGPPDASETRKWESKGGAVFDNHVQVWHFKGGDLELESMGSSVDTGTFSFVSVPNSPPPDAPKIDF